MADLELLLLRHGLAEPRGRGVEDGLRTLTAEGRQRTRQICQRACQLGLSAPSLLTSPLARARQTAEIAVAAGLAPALSCHDALLPGADPWPMLCDWWSRQDRPQRLILVGHEPDLGLLACRLLAAPPGALALKKAGIALLAWPAPPAGSGPTEPAQLRLLLTPKILARPWQDA
jgi:phosphohistidine phosphatase